MKEERKQNEIQLQIKDKIERRRSEAEKDIDLSVANSLAKQSFEWRWNGPSVPGALSCH